METLPPFEVKLAAPRGFCAGVDRAIEIVEVALEHFGPPVYVRHAIVHNVHVVANLEAKGAIFVESTSEVPDGMPIIFSAHGVPPQVKEKAKARGLETIDATCPLVTKVHNQARRYAKNDMTIILIGHDGHQEVTGTRGQAPDHIVLVQNVEDVYKLDIPNPENIAYISQTTLSVDETADIIKAIQERFPSVNVPRGGDICYATTNRQNATKELSKTCDLVLVIGSAHSSNSARMVEVAKTNGVPNAYLIDDASHINYDWFNGVNTIGITSGASAPDKLVQEVIEAIKATPRGATVEQVAVIDENMHFALPSNLRSLPVSQSGGC